MPARKSSRSDFLQVAAWGALCTAPLFGTLYLGNTLGYWSSTSAQFWHSEAPTLVAWSVTLAIAAEFIERTAPGTLSLLVAPALIGLGAVPLIKLRLGGFVPLGVWLALLGIGRVLNLLLGYFPAAIRSLPLAGLGYWVVYVTHYPCTTHGDRLPYRPFDHALAVSIGLLFLSAMPRRIIEPKLPE